MTTVSLDPGWVDDCGVQLPSRLKMDFEVHGETELGLTHDNIPGTTTLSDTSHGLETPEGHMWKYSLAILLLRK